MQRKNNNKRTKTPWHIVILDEHETEKHCSVKLRESGQNIKHSKPIQNNNEIKHDKTFIEKTKHYRQIIVIISTVNNF